MKRSGCNSVSALLGLTAVLFLTSSALMADEVDKKFNKEYNVQGNELLKINNRYGDVNVESWSENRIVIDVIVKVEHPSKEKAEKLLSMIDVIFSENDNTIEARTEIDKKFSFNGWGNGKKFSIDYEVKMPENLDFKVVNRYGGVKTAELSGHVDITVKYGTLYAAALTRGNEKPLNSVTLAYGKGVIDKAGWAELTLRYAGNMTVSNAQALLIDSRYSKLTIEDVSSVVLDSKYDNFNVDNIGNLVAESGYTSYSVGSVSKRVDINTNYGSVTIDNVTPGFEKVAVDASYCSVKVDMDNNASYTLNLETRYGGISFDEDRATIKHRIYDNNSKSVEAVIGDNPGSSLVKVTTRYGGVKVY